MKKAPGLSDHNMQLQIVELLLTKSEYCAKTSFLGLDLTKPNTREYKIFKKYEGVVYQESRANYGHRAFFSCTTPESQNFVDILDYTVVHVGA